MEKCQLEKEVASLRKENAGLKVRLQDEKKLKKRISILEKMMQFGAISPLHQLVDEFTKDAKIKLKAISLEASMAEYSDEERQAVESLAFTLFHTANELKRIVRIAPNPPVSAKPENPVEESSEEDNKENAEEV